MTSSHDPTFESSVSTTSYLALISFRPLVPNAATLVGGANFRAPAAAFVLLRRAVDPEAGQR
jgi:hypothetical protein